MSGFLTQHGVALEGPITTAQWPTPARAVTTLLAWQSAAFEPLEAFQADEVFLGTTGTATLTAILHRAALSVTYPLVYSGHETLLACALGYAPRVLSGTTYPIALGSGMFRHRLELANQLRAERWPTADSVAALLMRRLTVVLGTSLDVYEVQSAMIPSWELSYDASGVTLAVSYLGANVATESTTNTFAALHALPPPIARDIAHVDLVCRFGPFNATTPLADSARLDVTRVTLTCARSLRVDQSLSSAYAIAEPGCTSSAQLTGTLTVPYYSAREHGLLAAVRSATPYTLMLDAVRAPFAWRLWCPAVHLDSVNRPWNVNAADATIVFTALVPPSVPTWLAPVRFDARCVAEIESTTATHPLVVT